MRVFSGASIFTNSASANEMVVLHGEVEWTGVR